MREGNVGLGSVQDPGELEGHVAHIGYVFGSVERGVELDGGSPTTVEKRTGIAEKRRG